MAILRDGQGTGPVRAMRRRTAAELSSAARSSRRRRRNRDDAGSAARRRDAPQDAIRAFAAGNADLVLGGTFADLPCRPARQAAAQEACASIRRPACSAWFRCARAGRSTSPSCASCSARRSTATRSIARSACRAWRARDAARARARRDPGAAAAGMDGDAARRPLPALQAQVEAAASARTRSRRSGSRFPTGRARDLLLRELLSATGASSASPSSAQKAPRPPISR